MSFNFTSVTRPYIFVGLKVKELVRWNVSKKYPGISKKYSTTKKWNNCWILMEKYFIRIVEVLVSNTYWWRNFGLRCTHLDSIRDLGSDDWGGNLKTCGLRVKELIFTFFKKSTLAALSRTGVRLALAEATSPKDVMACWQLQKVQHKLERRTQLRWSPESNGFHW